MVSIPLCFPNFMIVWTLAHKENPVCTLDSLTRLQFLFRNSELRARDAECIMG